MFALFVLGIDELVAAPGTNEGNVWHRAIIVDGEMGWGEAKVRL